MLMVLTIESESLGSYDVEFIGTVDFFKMMKKSNSTSMAIWADDYHPLVFFNHRCHIVEVGYNHTFPILDVYVPTEKSTKDWDYKSSNYYQRTKKKTFPLLVSYEEIKEWKQSFKNI
jgi:hypothetical protein